MKDKGEDDTQWNWFFTSAWGGVCARPVMWLLLTSLQCGVHRRGRGPLSTSLTITQSSHSAQSGSVRSTSPPGSSVEKPQGCFFSFFLFCYRSTQQKQQQPVLGMFSWLHSQCLSMSPEERRNPPRGFLFINVWLRCGKLVVCSIKWSAVFQVRNVGYGLSKQQRIQNKKSFSTQKC